MQSIQRLAVPLVASGLIAVAGCQPNGATETIPPPQSMPADEGESSPPGRADEREGEAATLEKAATSVDRAGRQFIDEAALINMAEIELSQAVLAETQTQAVREFAQKMIRDHSRASEDLAALARDLDVQTPTALGEQAQSNVQTLQALEGQALDAKYVEIMVEDHEKAVSTFQRATKSLENALLQQWATLTLPMLQEHLDHAQALQSGRPYMGPQAVAAPHHGRHRIPRQ